MGASACGCDRGQSQLDVRFNKNVFFGNEVAQALIAVDNHECALGVTEVEFQVVQKLSLKNQQHS